MPGKAIIFSAPSGAGKTTLVKHVISVFPELAFSVSACSRPKRPGETDGKDYYFLSRKQFEEKIKRGEFLEWEEVYSGIYYGTLKSEIDKIWSAGKHVIFDVDVVGGLNLKKYFGNRALAIFVKPPSLEVLKERLQARGTENADSLKKRISKAEWELGFSKKFDKIIVNDKLDEAMKESEKLVGEFIRSNR